MREGTSEAGDGTRLPIAAGQRQVVVAQTVLGGCGGSGSHLRVGGLAMTSEHFGRGQVLRDGTGLRRPTAWRAIARDAQTFIVGAFCCS